MSNLLDSRSQTLWSPEEKMGHQDAEFDWGMLVPHMIHPLPVAIIEAHWYLDQPLSASQLSNLLGSELSTISYHVRSLSKVGALRLAFARPVRGSLEKFYALKD